MPRTILHLLPGLLLALAVPATVEARAMTVRMDRIESPVATLAGVEARIAWPADADAGALELRARRVDADALGYHARDVRWRCPLRRPAESDWRCEGVLEAAGIAPMRLSVDLGPAVTRASLTRGAARFTVTRSAATPDDTVLDLSQVPLAWTQALLARAWPDATLRDGRLDGRLVVAAPARGALRISGPLALSGGALETADGSIAAEGLGARLAIDVRLPADATLVSIDGTFEGGQLLSGSTYVVLPETPVAFGVDAMQRGSAGWELPAFRWRDGTALDVTGRAALTPDAGLASLDLALRSRDLSPVAGRYLSGALGVAGLGGLTLHGGLELDLAVRDGAVARADARLQAVDIREAAGRFGVTALDGDLRISEGAPIESALRWSGGALAAIPFGAGTLPLRSAGGMLVARAPVAVSMLDGTVRIDPLTLRLPDATRGLEIAFGLAVDGLDIGTLSKTLGGPAFRGTLSGRIPTARYAGERIDFDGGLTLQAFDGEVEVRALAMERPFGVAPTVTADLALHRLDLLAITEVFDFGSIGGRMEGRIDGLRLVDWQPVAFDAEVHTVPMRGVRQRISQRAVQDISSVGDASFVSTLQGRAIALFDDFGYRRIALSCRLVNEVCTMGGTGSAGNGFTIVEGAGLPRLSVVGYNRRVDWPTLLERVAAVGSGDVAPVID